MKLTFRITARLLHSIHHDLSRPHEYALERVGFIACRTARIRDGIAVLAETYRPVAEADYIKDERYGALINAAAIRAAMEYAYTEQMSIVHVHRHEHRGRPRFSDIDLDESAKFVPNFWNVAPKTVHGTLVLSHDEAAGLLWSPLDRKPHTIAEIVIVGRPTRSFVASSYEQTASAPELSRS